MRFIATDGEQQWRMVNVVVSGDDSQWLVKDGETWWSAIASRNDREVSKFPLET